MLKFIAKETTDAKIIILARNKDRASKICQVMVLIDDVVYVDSLSLFNGLAVGKYGYLRVMKKLINRHKKGSLKHYAYENTLLLPLMDFYQICNEVTPRFDVQILARIFQHTMQLIAYKNKFDINVIAGLDLHRHHTLARYMYRQNQIDLVNDELMENKGYEHVLAKIAEQLNEPIPGYVEFMEDLRVNIPVVRMDLELNIIQKLMLIFVR